MVDGKSIVTPEALRGKYRIQSLLGEGAQGRTWLGKRLLDGCEVAIKELKYIGDFKQLELFAREAEVLQSLDVKGVPKLFESITGGMGPSYLVQEYVPYPSLLDVLKSEGRFGEREVLEILLCIGQILYELENHYVPPIIHRDIKPSNILYHRAGEGCEVFLIDFGAVANPQKQAGGSTIAGTFGYMAPEQLQGNAAIQSDYYGAGATALHLLTGVSPCDMPADVFRLQFDDVLSEKAPGLSCETAELLHVLLAPRIEDRPGDANAMISMVQSVLEGSSHGLRARKKSLLERLFEWIERDLNRRSQCTCRGRIRGLKTITLEEYTVDVIEYTYSVEGRIYCGFFRNHADTGIEILGEGVCPCDEKGKVDTCTVRYTAGWPSDCFLPRQTVYVSGPVLEKLSAAHRPFLPSRNAVWDFADRLWMEEASAENALFCVLARILVKDLAEVQEYRTALRSFYEKYEHHLTSILERYDGMQHDGYYPEAYALRSNLKKARQHYEEIPAVDLHEELTELWKTVQTMLRGDMRKLLQQTYGSCRKIAQQGPILAQWASELRESVQNTVDLVEKCGISMQNIDSTIRTQIQSKLERWTRELADRIDENVTILEKPLELLRGMHSHLIHDIPYAPFLGYIEKGRDYCHDHNAVRAESGAMDKYLELFAKRMGYLAKLFTAHLEGEA